MAKPDPKEVRERVIKRYYGALQKMNFGSTKNIDKNEEVVLGSSVNDDIFTALIPIQYQSTAEMSEEEVFFSEIPITKASTHGSYKRKVSLEVD